MATDPFSGASKPLPPSSLLYSKEPLQFAATLTGGALLTPFELAPSKTNRKRSPDGIPNIPESSSATNSPIYLHRRTPGAGSTSVSAVFGLEALKLSEENGRVAFGHDHRRRNDVPEIGSDEWMDNVVARCVDRAELALDLSNLGLTHLSDHISSLQNLVILPSRSPAPPPYIDSPSHPDSPRRSNPSSPFLPGTSLGMQQQSPGIFNGRTPIPSGLESGRRFQRYASAPSGGLGLPSPAQARMREMSNTLAPSASFSGMDSPIQHVNIASGLPSTSTLNTRPFQRVPSKGFAPPGSAVLDDEEEILLDRSPERRKKPGASPRLVGSSGYASLKASSADLAVPFEVVSPAGSSTLAPNRRTPFGRKVSFQDSIITPMLHTTSSPDLTRSSIGSPTGTSAHASASDSRLSPRMRRRLQATSSAPASGEGAGSPKDVPLGGGAAKSRAFRRTASGTSSPALNGKWAGKANGDVELLLANNELTRLPSSLFEITNLVVLSLRHNRLKALPAAVGQLCNLKELNLGNNKIETFPPTLLDLQLDNFYFPMNPLTQPPKDKPLESFPSGRRLGPLQRHVETVTSLRSTCISVLLSSRQPDDLPPLLSDVDWAPEAGSTVSYGLQDALALHEAQTYLTLEESETIMASLRSSQRAAAAASRKVHYSIPDPTASPSSRSRRSRGPSTQDDASTNVFFSPCPSPIHTRNIISAHSRHRSITRRIYSHSPAEERIEWTKVGGSGEAVPIMWKGCSPGCLRFLEVAEEGADAEGDEGEATETDERDGFDLEELELGWDV